MRDIGYPLSSFKSHKEVADGMERPSKSGMQTCRGLPPSVTASNMGSIGWKSTAGFGLPHLAVRLQPFSLFTVFKWYIPFTISFSLRDLANGKQMVIVTVLCVDMPT